MMGEFERRVVGAIRQGGAIAHAGQVRRRPLLPPGREPWGARPRTTNSVR